MTVKLKDTKFFISETDPKKLPQSISEVAFVGRSNVGKSSIINAVCNQKNLARTSNTPGRTRAINVFTPSNGRWIVDLPGYGFAKVSDEEKDLWKQMIEGYITGRKNLKNLYILIDGLVGPMDLDIVMVEWIKSLNIKFKIIVNKTDRISNLDLEKLKSDIADSLQIPRDLIFCVSAKTKAGIGNITGDVGNLLL
ncbi:MAG: ribosome biogenesis GTP-binding protein YihA/YsxC [Endomicrobiaceae bacterium]|nr:ribosome biogenesis GTP-binding protein YihA/YsxC [Endomicrobiaceae bacterium]